MTKLIKNEEDHRAALEEIERLIDLDPAAGSQEAERLELMAHLVETYEKERYSVAAPDPVEAILFRMEQQELAPRDLIPYIGSRSKVSEILGRKRPLTLSMVRALHEGLGIPAHVLIQDAQPEVQHEEQESEHWTKYPLKAMMARGWIEDSVQSVRDFFSRLPSPLQRKVLCKQTNSVRSARSMDPYALNAWATRVLILANEQTDLPAYHSESLSPDFLNRLVRESCRANGPVAAQATLRSIGIPLIIEPHLPHTYLDGAAILLMAERPVIGMTIRHDRLDNFWFTLLHEIGHVKLHAGAGLTEFFDDLDVDNSGDMREREADAFALGTLIPPADWQTSAASRSRMPQAAESLAQKLHIHPAIVAGRMRHEFKAYRLCNHLVGHHEVRVQFKDVQWTT